MTLTLNALLAMAWRTVRNAREGAEEVLSLGVPREALWTALVLVVVLSTLLTQVTALLLTGQATMPGLPIGPAAAGFLQVLILAVMVFAIFWIGRAMGGTGSFAEAVLLVTWLQFIMVCLQVIQTAAIFLMPPLSGLVGIFGLVLFLWLLTNFIAVLHGFKSLAQVFIMIIISAIGLAFGLSLILAVIGVAVPMVATP